MELKVEGMSCGGCVKSVTKIIAKHTNLEAERIRVDLTSGIAEFDSESVDTGVLLTALGSAGFEASLRTDT